MKAFSPSFSQFAAAMIAVFALSSCTKERAEDLAPMGGKSELPSAIADHSGTDAFDMDDQKAGASHTTEGLAHAQRAAQERSGLGAVAILSQERDGKGHLDIQQDVGRVEMDGKADGQTHIGREEFPKRPEIVPANSGLSGQAQMGRPEVDQQAAGKVHMGREEFTKRGEIVAAQGGQGQQFGQAAK